jgi:hypothetical protein
MRFRVQQLVTTPGGDQWEDRGWPEASGDEAGADAVLQVAEEAGSYRLRPAYDDAAEPALYRVGPGGSVVRVEAI